MITSSQLERGPVTRPYREGHAGVPFLSLTRTVCGQSVDHSAGHLVWVIIAVRKGHKGTTGRTITFSLWPEGDGLTREFSRNEAAWGN